jgi:hypothetical protein
VTRLLATIFWIILSAWVAPAPYAAGGDENLLGGDPSFETGMSTWQAISTLRKADYLSNRNAALRIDGLPRAVVRRGAASVGKAYLHLLGAQGMENVVTAPPVKLEGKKEYTFSFDVRCDRTINLSLSLVRIDGDFDGKDNETKVVKKSSQDWSRVSHTSSTNSGGTYVPQVTWWGEAKCDLDAFTLRDGGDSSYVPKSSLSASLALAEDVSSPMPNLLVNDTPCTVKLPIKVRLSLFSAMDEREVKVKLSAKSAEGGIHDVQTKFLHVPRGQLIDLLWTLRLPAVGCWLITAHIGHDGGQNSKPVTQMTVARIDRYQDALDPFFGVHQKWTPIVDLIGFGSIRDMHLYEWGSVMPTPFSWVAPEDKELSLIKKFRERGGHYLVTLMAENPMKKPWNEKSWGEFSFGPLPLWSGTAGEITKGMFGFESVALKIQAVTQYLQRVAKFSVTDEFEFMNEPVFYMPPEHYANLLKVATGAIRDSMPQATIVAFANPPYYPSLPGGKNARFKKADPWYWFDQVVEATELDGVDVIGVHTYGRYRRKETPETGYGGMGEATWAAALKSRVEQRLGRSVQLWITEKGISSVPWKNDLLVDGKQTDNKVCSPLMQARWLVRAQIDARAQGVGRFYVFNRPWDENWNDRYAPHGDLSYTMFEPDGQPRPILVAQSVLIHQLAHWDPSDFGTISNNIHYAIFKRGYRNRIVFWMTGKDKMEEQKDRKSIMVCPSWLAAGKAISMFGDHLKELCSNGHLYVGYSPVYVEVDKMPKQDAFKELKVLK